MYRPGLPLSEFDNAMTVAKLNGEWVGPKRSTNGEGRKNYVDRGPEPVIWPIATPQPVPPQARFGCLAKKRSIRHGWGQNEVQSLCARTAESLDRGGCEFLDTSRRFSRI